jgi:hypothetical protein
MSADRYIVIPDWDSFEHPDVQRHTTPPPWIKSYTRELDEDAYQDLTSHCRALLHDLRRLYAIKRGRLRLDTATLSRRFGYRVTTPHIESLNHAGFIRIEACDSQAVDVDTDEDRDQHQKDVIRSAGELRDVARAKGASSAGDSLDEVETSSAAQDETSQTAGDGGDGFDVAEDLRRLLRTAEVPDERELARRRAVARRAGA